MAITASGDWWRVEDRNTLYIYCAGDMPDYDDPYGEYFPEVERPWHDFAYEIRSVIISDGVTGIGSYAFDLFENLECVRIPYGVTSIGDCAFESCGSLCVLTLPESVTSIGDYAFCGCGFSHLAIPGGIASISGDAFSSCRNLISIDIPDGVTSIGPWAFSSCESLTSVTIPTSVTSIEEYAFNGCAALTDVYYTGTQAQWNAITVGSYNAPLTNAAKRYEYSPPPLTAPEVSARNVGNPLAAVAGAHNQLTRAFVQLRQRLANVPENATANAGTITGITMNGVSKGTSGVVDLGTVLTEHQDISGKVDVSAVGAANGVAELDSAGKVPSAQLPSYVDDVLEYASLSAFPATGESGKIYVATDSNLTYRWSGSAYVEISPSLALGETFATAYRGDRGKIAYEHSQATGNAHGMTKADIELGNVDNTSDANKPISTATQTALNGKVDKVTGKGLSTEDYTTAEKSKLSGIASGATANAAATVAPLMDGAASVGASAKYAREDHQHPSDTSRASAADVEAIKTLLQSAVLYRTASGNPATFNDGAAADVRDLKVTITPTQEGSGDPSPTNVRPISGVSSVTVTRTGKNLCSVSSGNNRVIGSVKRGVTYTFSMKTGGNVGVSLKQDTMNGSVFASSSPYSAPLSFTPDANYELFLNGWSSVSGKSFDELASEYMLVEGSAAVEYEAPQPQTVTVTLYDGSDPLTVYGGTLDVTTGVLTVDTACINADPAGDWKVSTSYSGGFFYRIADYYGDGSGHGAKPFGKILCSHAKTVNSLSQYVKGACYCDNSFNIRIMEPGTTLNEWKSFLQAQIEAGTPVQMLFELENPATYQLTPQQLATLHGYNSVSTDAGSVAVEYRADVALSLGGTA